MSDAIHKREWAAVCVQTVLIPLTTAAICHWVIGSLSTAVKAACFDQGPCLQEFAVQIHFSHPVVYMQMYLV